MIAYINYDHGKCSCALSFPTSVLQ